MSRSVGLIDSLEELAVLLYGPNRLAYNHYESTMPELVPGESNIIKVIYPFMVSFLDKGSSLTKLIIEAYKRVFNFLPLSNALLEAIVQGLSDFSRLNSDVKSGHAAESDFPVAYFLAKARNLPGFSLLAFPARDFILGEGSRVIPALLTACSAMPHQRQHHDLLPDDIISAPDKYRKRGGISLAESTREDYRRVLIKFMPYIIEVYRILGYGSHGLFKDEEMAELSAEEERRQKYYMRTNKMPFFSFPEVLKPHLLRQLLLTEGEENEFVL